jgi:hypothetical protein
MMTKQTPWHGLKLAANAADKPRQLQVSSVHTLCTAPQEKKRSKQQIEIMIY